MITLFNVTKKYPNGHTALDNVSIQIEPGEMVFLQGHSGAGKSTLLKLIALQEFPTRGHIIVSGKNLSQIKSAAIPYYRRRLGFIAQNPKLLIDHSVFENVALPLIIAGYEKNDIPKRVRAALERVGLLEKENFTPLELSEGEQHRVGIARAVVHKPKFLIADEPTGNLDPTLSLEIMKLFVRFQQVGVTVLITSHDLHLLERFPFRKLQLAKGQLIQPQMPFRMERKKEELKKEFIDD